MNANSTLDFGTGNSNNLLFTSLTLGASSLNVKGWTGIPYGLGATLDPNTDPTQDRLRFSADPGFGNGNIIPAISFFDDADVFLSFGMQVGFAGGGFEIVAVPEPATAALIGVVALCALSRRRRASPARNRPGAKPRA